VVWNFVVLLWTQFLQVQPDRRIHVMSHASSYFWKFVERGTLFGVRRTHMFTKQPFMWVKLQKYINLNTTLHVFEDNIDTIKIVQINDIVPGLLLVGLALFRIQLDYSHIGVVKYVVKRSDVRGGAR